MTSSGLRVLGISLLALVAGSCSADAYGRRAEHTADRLLAERDDRVLGQREESVVYPAIVAPPTPDEALESEPAPPDPGGGGERPAATVLDLRQSLAIAYSSSRQMTDRREGLHLQALALSGTRHAYTPQLALTLAYLLDEVPDGDDLNSGGAAFSASQILPTGADLTLSAASGAAAVEGEEAFYDSFVSLRLAQPLLRGGGYAVTHEALIQAERSLVYAIREFELFREDFSIDVARRYYNLVNQKQSIDNQRRNLESNEFGRRQAEALFGVGRANELDVLRARRSELTARNGLLEGQESLDLALDTFRIFLGLPPDQPIDVEPDSPAFTPVAYEVRSAVEVALMNRLDLLNRQQQLEDVERSLRLARNALLPDLDLVASTTHGTLDGDSFGGSDFERTDSTLAVTFGIPLDRVRERNAYRANEIAVARARRDLEEFEDQLRVSIQSSFRELERRLQSLEIQRQLIEDQTKNLRIAELRFERGELPNRDVVEANQSLLDAQNALIDEQVNYEIARLQLLRDLGILFVDETGMWKR